MTPEELQQASIAEIAAGRLPLEAQRRLARPRSDAAFTSTLSVAEHHAIRSVGFTPVGQALGSCVYAIGYTGTWNCGYYGYGRSTGPAWTASPGWQAGGWSGPTASVVEARALRTALYDARTRAMQRMREEAALLGGDGVVAVRLTVAPFPAGGLEFQAIGTAVRADGPVRPPQPFLSDLSGQEFALLIGAGWVPVALVLGIAVMVRHDDWSVVRQNRSWTNQEVAGWTELVTATREGARASLRRDCARWGAETAVVRELTLEVGERRCPAVQEGEDHLAEAMIVGTAITPFRHAGGNAPALPLPVLRLQPGRTP